MITHVYFFSFLFITSLLFSLIEIQSEGEYGWAVKFPTWRIDNKWTKRFNNKRPLTGYHVYFALFMVVMVHIPYFLGFTKITLPNELLIISYLILFFILEDFLWFVFNPHFGINKFKPEYIWWWAPTWWWIMPRDYWIYAPIGITLYILSRLL
jgi:hypothetical protein